MSKINFTYTNLTPFKWFVLENFPFIEADFDALTNWQLFCKLGKEMNKIINSVNASGQQVETLTTAFNNLQNYVNNYFDNLDIQEEVNNKLNMMVEDGTLDNILNNYINVTKIYNTHEDLIMDTTLVNNMKVKTLGYYEMNDGGGADYIVTSQIDNTKYQEQLSNGLFLELIIQNIDFLQFGAKNDKTFDSTTFIKKAINYTKTSNKTIILNRKSEFLISESLDISNLYCDFGNSVFYTNNNIDIFTIDTTQYYTTIKNCELNCEFAENGIHIIEGRKVNIFECNFSSVSNKGITYDKGYELSCKDLNITGNGSGGTIGLNLNAGDSHFTDIVLIDCQTAIFNNGLNFFTRIHAWILTPNLLINSKFFEVNNNSNIKCNQIYCDTYRIFINSIASNATYANINELMVYYNSKIMTVEAIGTNKNYIYYNDNSSVSSQINIINSQVNGISINDTPVQLTNEEYFLGKIELITVFNLNVKIPTLILTENDASVEYITNEVLTMGNIVELNVLAKINTDDLSSRTVKLGKIPNKKLPPSSRNISCEYSKSEYAYLNNIYCFITNDGNINVTIPATNDGNIFVKLHYTYISNIL